MSLPEICIRRPIFAVMLNLIIVLFGVVGYMRLPVRELPDVDPPIVTVTTQYRGANAEVIEADVVVYGGTAGGVAAACTTVKLGKTVALADFGKHIGGLTSGGLGYTDIGTKAAIGGFSRDFYKRLGKVYGKAEAWTFAPSVAEKELRALLSESKVPVKFEQRLKSAGEAGELADALAREHDAGHEALPVVAVLADRERLALRAEDHLLVGHHAAHPDRVHADAGRARAAPCSRQHLRLGGVGRPRG